MFSDRLNNSITFSSGQSLASLHSSTWSRPCVHVSRQSADYILSDLLFEIRVNPIADIHTWAMHYCGPCSSSSHLPQHSCNILWSFVWIQKHIVKIFITWKKTWQWGDSLLQLLFGPTSWPTPIPFVMNISLGLQHVYSWLLSTQGSNKTWIA